MKCWRRKEKKSYWCKVRAFYNNFLKVGQSCTQWVKIPQLTVCENPKDIEKGNKIKSCGVKTNQYFIFKLLRLEILVPIRLKINSFPTFFLFLSSFLGVNKFTPRYTLSLHHL
uniref:Uncharacterized protein n=1 Tax=Cacopsylla melanoneura TaxID=428564 RepID=A0A8D8QFA6_9HEMI